MNCWANGRRKKVGTESGEGVETLRNPLVRLMPDRLFDWDLLPVLMGEVDIHTRDRYVCTSEVPWPVVSKSTSSTSMYINRSRIVPTKSQIKSRFILTSMSNFLLFNATSTIPNSRTDDLQMRPLSSIDVLKTSDLNTAEDRDVTYHLLITQWLWACQILVNDISFLFFLVFWLESFLLSGPAPIYYGSDWEPWFSTDPIHGSGTKITVSELKYIPTTSVTFRYLMLFFPPFAFTIHFPMTPSVYY